MSDKPVPVTQEPSHALVAPTFEDMSMVEGVQQRPAEIDPKDRTGKEDIGRDEIKLPRLTVAQGLHPQVVPGDTKYIPGLAIGMMFNDVSEEIYGTGPLTVVPVYRYVTRIEFDPEDRKVVLDRNVPAGDPRTKWSRGTGPDGKDERPRATEFVEFVSLLLRPGKEPERIIVTIKTTNKEMREAAQMWTTYIDNRSGPIFSGMYKISSHVARGMNKETGQQTMYGVFVVKQAGYIPTNTPSGKMLYDYAEMFHVSSKGKTVVGEYEDQAEDEFDPNKMGGQASHPPFEKGAPGDM